MLQINELAMAHGSQLLFSNVSLKLNDQQRYAIVGANGTGKSTLLRVIAGEESPIAGTIAMPKDAQLGWLKQDQYRYEDTLIIDVVIQGKKQLWQALEEKDHLLAQADLTEKQGYRLAELEEIIAHQQGYSAEAMAENLLSGLGIDPNYHRKPLKALSGGYKLRVLLAQTLFMDPQILLLDEPTNHLDIVSIRWLEQYLKKDYQGLLIFVSHDFDFINNLAHHILDIDYGEINQYSGHYQKYLNEKKSIEEQKMHLKKHAEKKIAELQSFVDRFGAKASKAKQAKSKAKMIDKIELPDIKHSSRQSPHFSFSQAQQSGKHILKVTNLAKSYHDKVIFNDVNFKVTRGEKIAIIGENGAGKSTLVKTLLELVSHEHGEITWGHQAALSYFSQDHHDTLKQSVSAYEWLNQASPATAEPVVHKTLAQVLFKQEEVNKNILNVSGGEAARLLIAKMMLERANVLLLDEPTNHLDIDASEALAEALARFQGTVLVVSHNRHFLSKFAKRVFFMKKGQGIEDHHCSFSEYEASLE